MAGEALSLLSRAEPPRRRRGRQRRFLRRHLRTRAGDPLRRLGGAACLVGGVPAGPLRLHDLDSGDPAAPVDGAGTAGLSHRPGRSGDDPRRGGRKPGQRLLPAALGAVRHGRPLHRRQLQGHVPLLPLDHPAGFLGSPAVHERQRQLRSGRVLLPDRHEDIGRGLGVLPAGQGREGCAQTLGNQIRPGALPRGERLSPGGLPGPRRPAGAGAGRTVGRPRPPEGGLAQSPGAGPPRRRQRRDPPLPRGRGRSPRRSRGHDRVAVDHGDAVLGLAGLRRHGPADLHRCFADHCRGRARDPAGPGQRPGLRRHGAGVDPRRPHRGVQPLPRLHLGLGGARLRHGDLHQRPEADRGDGCVRPPAGLPGPPPRPADRSPGILLDDLPHGLPPRGRQSRRVVLQDRTGGSLRQRGEEPRAGGNLLARHRLPPGRRRRHGPADVCPAAPLLVAPAPGRLSRCGGRA